MLVLGYLRGTENEKNSLLSKEKTKLLHKYDSLIQRIMIFSTYISFNNI